MLQPPQIRPRRARAEGATQRNIPTTPTPIPMPAPSRPPCPAPIATASHLPSRARAHPRWLRPVFPAPKWLLHVTSSLGLPGPHTTPGPRSRSHALPHPPPQPSTAAHAMPARSAGHRPMPSSPMPRSKARAWPAPARCNAASRAKRSSTCTGYVCNGGFVRGSLYNIIPQNVSREAFWYD
jgi:hypothetical protein